MVIPVFRQLQALSPPPAAPSGAGGFNPLSLGLLGMGAGMLEAAGPQPYKVGLGQAFGHGLGSGLGAMTLFDILELQKGMAERNGREVDQSGAKSSLNADTVGAQAPLRGMFGLSNFFGP